MYSHESREFARAAVKTRTVSLIIILIDTSAPSDVQGIRPTHTEMVIKSFDKVLRLNRIMRKYYNAK